MIVAVSPEFPIRKKISVPNGMTPETLHITLLHINVENITSIDQYYAMNRFIDDVAGMTSVMEGTLVKLDRFENVRRVWSERGSFTPKEPTDAIIYKVESEPLVNLRAGLVDSFKTLSFPYSDTFTDFIPHITVKYVPAGEMVETDLELPFTFPIKHLEIWDAAARTIYPFNNN